MSTVDVNIETSGDAPTALPVSAADAIAAAQAYLAMTLSVLEAVQQSALSASEYASVAFASSQTAATAATTAVAAAQAAVAGTGFLKPKTVNDANYAAGSGDSGVHYGTITAPRVVTLPPANGYVTSIPFTVLDQSGQCSATATITVQPSGSDNIEGTLQPELADAYAGMDFWVNVLANGWTVK